MSLPYPPPFQDLATLSEHISCAESTIEGWVKQGLFPPPKKIGGKRLWAWKDVEMYLAPSQQSAAGSPDEEAEQVRKASREASAAGR